jgi:hypothetical protein
VSRGALAASLALALVAGLASAVAPLVAPAAAAPPAVRHARAASGPVEWLTPGDPLHRELELLRATGLADTAHVLFTRPLARKTVAAIVARARRLHPDSRDPSLVRLERAFGQELVDRGWAAPEDWTAPLATVTGTWDDAPAEREPGAPGEPAPPPDGDMLRLRLSAYGDGTLLVSEDNTRFEDRSRAGGRLDVESGAFLVHLDAWVGRLRDAERFSDVLVKGSDFAAYAEDFYASLSTKPLDASLGKGKFGWGPGASGSLLWSSTADPVTYLSLGSTLFRHVRLTAVHGDVDATRGARIAGHRLEWFPSPRLTVGLGEAVRYTSATWQPLYLVSLLPYTWVQRLLAQDALDGTGAAEPNRNNVMAALDASWVVQPGRTLYGEFLLDDQGLAAGGQPTRIGYQLGGLATLGLGRLGRGDLRLEYSRVYNYVYATFYGEDFIHHSKAIGYPEGPDVRRLDVDFRLAPSPDWEYRLAGSIQDHGEGTLGTFFDPDSGAASGSELSGVVERETRVLAGARWWPRDNVDVGVELTQAWLRDARHVEGAEESRTEARVFVRLRK